MSALGCQDCTTALTHLWRVAQGSKQKMIVQDIHGRVVQHMCTQRGARICTFLSFPDRLLAASRLSLWNDGELGSERLLFSVHGGVRTSIAFARARQPQVLRCHTSVRARWVKGRSSLKCQMSANLNNTVYFFKTLVDGERDAQRGHCRSAAVPVPEAQVGAKTPDHT